MKITVTGGAGFIGGHVVNRLLTEGIVVTVIDDLSSGFIGNIPLGSVDFFEGSILNKETLTNSLHGSNAVIHLAARPSVPRSVEDPEESHEANATGTLQVLEISKKLGIERVVVASSSSVYGSNPITPKFESLTPMPMSPYAVSKLCGEAYAAAYNYCYGTSNIAYRFFNVYGPGQRPDHAYAAVVPRFVHAALRDEPLQVFGDGRQTRDFTFVADVAEILAKTVTEDRHVPTPVNLAFGSRASLLDVIELLEADLGKSLTLEFREARVGDVRHSQADSTLIRSVFADLEPEVLSTGISTTIEWMRGLLLSESY